MSHDMPPHLEPPPTPAAPPPRVLTLADIQPDPDGRITWWKPGLADLWKHSSWKHAWAGAVLAILVAGAGALVAFGFVVDVIGALINLWYVAGLLITILAAGATVAMKRIFQSRTTPFCIHCGYGLDGLPDHYNCPECGRPYSYALIEDYRRDPSWFILRWKRLKGRIK